MKKDFSSFSNLFQKENFQKSLRNENLKEKGEEIKFLHSISRILGLS